jgi:hypothetical protein
MFKKKQLKSNKKFDCIVSSSFSSSHISLVAALQFLSSRILHRIFIFHFTATVLSVVPGFSLEVRVGSLKRKEKK